jgi:hypothetical protein
MAHKIDKITTGNSPFKEPTVNKLKRLFFRLINKRNAKR